jgi:hypothetical protein
MEEQPPRRCRGINRLVEDYKTDPQGFELSGQGRQVTHRSSQAIQLHHGQNIELPPPGLFQQAIQSRALTLRSQEPPIGS